MNDQPFDIFLITCVRKTGDTQINQTSKDHHVTLDVIMSPYSCISCQAMIQL